ncbi:branched-chain amino acid ABC transporter substrate-binding protein [Conexibacter sp. JD483]|uniref:branched-chain amino acid ABC transporter substrate-binding protein n=1 Tax=unclassified Conexibacter TaxID=2627773 RepID=UPI00271A5A71|nr:MULTISPECIES: branched-chain amino acid ABC transporter substrate-binding protein [unclassified Conexibacter]MDO8184814.1 branched-chain amino acid ABC transporter substrate-binding protein [Conexibacter sp. CPCC 205706]MDO8196589.1 branched-chain amino acid ABC transporter substrate-binding protein [Conexibacter sp. CPCC 205762]MDR9368698.1 branched-chain amino acid ABC transporter substrate-binding protein [Conexibacter sp. JD483]
MCLLATAASLVVAGCGDGGDPAETATVAGPTLTIYTSMPFEGPDSAAARDVLRGEQLALREAGGRVGRYGVELVPLDAATEKENRWDPAQISENARRAAKDDSAIGYIGEFHSGSSAISIPLLNEVGLLEISPTDSAEALTQRTLAVPDSPVKYYPKARDLGRTFGRVVGNDRGQAAAQVAWMRREGVRRLFEVTDEDPVGAGFLMAMRPLLRAAGITTVGREDVDPHQPDPRDLVEKIARADPDAVFYAGDSHEAVVRLWQDLSVADTGLKLFVPGSIADPTFIEQIGAAAASTYVTRPLLGLRAYPPEAQRLAQRFAKEYGAAPLPEALYGYEAMRALLAAAQQAEEAAGEGPLERVAVRKAFFGLRRDGTVLGDYEILPSGDTSLQRFGAFRIADGRLRYVAPLLGDS